MIRQFVMEHYTLYLLVANPLLGLALGWFGRCFMGVLGKAHRPLACAICAFVSALCWIAILWSDSGMHGTSSVGFGEALLYFGAALLIAPAFAVYLVKRYGRSAGPL